MNIISVHSSQSNFKLNTYINISYGINSTSELIQNGHYHVEREMPAEFIVCSESSPFTEVQLCCGFLIFGEPTGEHVGWEGMKLKQWLGAVPSQLRFLLIFKLSVCDVTYACVEQCKGSFSARHF